MVTKINVLKIDQGLYDEIKKAHTALKSSSDDSKEIHLNINSASGDKEIAIQIAEILHSDASIIPVTNVSGDLDVAASLLVSAGKIGRRIADPKSTFIINDGEPYGKDSKPEDLDGTDYAIYDALVSLTGKKFTIFNKMLEGGSISSKMAKKSGIIDDISGFKSAFRPQKSLKGRARKKSVSKMEAVVTPEQSENSEANAESPEVKPVTRTRKTSVKSESSEGVQRGRIK